MNSVTDPHSEAGDADHPVAMASQLTVYGLFYEQARLKPEALAIEMGTRQLSYGALLNRVDLAASMLLRNGVRHGDRIAVISENSPEYLVIFLAAARIGAIVACLNWRLSSRELQHSVDLVTPTLMLASDRFAPMVDQLALGGLPVLSLVAEEKPPYTETDEVALKPVKPEDGLLLLYTSGTTGMPKGALISHRAEIARMMVLRLDLGIDSEDAYLAWSPMFHMGGTEHSLAALMMGGSVVITDGFDVSAIIAAIATHRLGWLLLVPATIEPLLDPLREDGAIVKGVKVVGCMADLVPTESIAEISSLLDAPFFNSFGATETGLPPLSGNLLSHGSNLNNLGKQQSSWCAFRLLDPEGREVARGKTGEGAVRGPTLFSGYWGAPDVTNADFRDGWFHMGDLFQQSTDGSFEFVGRAKYMIKSGGENIYPAEIERLLLADPRIEDAVVVRKPDRKWGEIPVAVIARKSADLTAPAVREIYSQELARYKQPKEIHFIDLADLPRSATGKIIRADIENWVIAQGASPLE